MFSLLHLLSYVGAMGAFLFVTLSLASGLLWLAELIEEHSRYAKAIGIRGIYTIIALHVLLLFTDSLPPLSIFFSIACHLVYLSNFTSSWPYISLSSPRFILSCVLVIADHFTWFYHFANKASEAKRRPKYRYGAGGGYGAGGQQTIVQEHSFMDVAAFFGICVWAIPLFLFLSLSANDNALPNIHSGPPSPAYANGVDLSTPLHSSGSRFNPSASGAKSQTSLVRAVLEPILALLPRLKRRSKRDRADEGLLAPRTPVRGSPLHTPVRMSSFSNGGAGGAGSGGYFPWGSDGERDQASASSSSSVYGAASGSGGNGGNASARPRTPTSGSFLAASPDKSRSTMYGALGLDLSASDAPSPPTSRTGSISLAGPSHPPPRRVQSEAQVQGAGSARNPRGIATRNGRPALEAGGAGTADTAGNGDKLEKLNKLEEPDQTSTGKGKSHSPPRVSLGPMDGKRLEGVEIVESQTLTKRKAD